MTLAFDAFSSALGLAVFATLMIVAAIGDIRSFLISNRLNLLIAGSFFIFAFPMGLSWTQFGLHVGVGILTSIISIGLFFAGVYGGGDAKLTGAAAFWLGPAAMMSFLFYTALAGGALVLILVTGRTLAKKFGLPKRPKWARRMLRNHSAVPYGVALCIGAICAVPRTVWFSSNIGGL